MRGKGETKGMDREELEEEKGETEGRREVKTDREGKGEEW